MFKDEVVAMDQGLFDKNGSRLSPGNSIYDDFNSVTINKLKCARSRSVTVTSPGYPNLLGQAKLAFQPTRVRVAIRVSRFKTKQYFQDGGRRGFSIF